MPQTKETTVVAGDGRLGQVQLGHRLRIGTGGRDVEEDGADRQHEDDRGDDAAEQPVARLQHGTVGGGELLGEVAAVAVQQTVDRPENEQPGDRNRDGWPVSA